MPLPVFPPVFMFAPLLLALVAAMPVTIMTGQALPSSVYYLALASALAVVIQHRFAGAPQCSRQYRGLLVCMAMPLVVALFAAVWNRHLSGADLEMALRFLLGVWLPLPALSTLQPHQVRQMFWGYVVAAVAAT